jgi:hypothetical protein
MTPVHVSTDVQVTLTAVVAAITAIGALGTAASGLVDSTKAFWGGVSNVGFGQIKKALEPYKAALSAAQSDWTDTIRASWINGMAMDDQKSAAKSLIRLGLSADNAEALATAGHVNPAALTAVITAIDAGAALTPDQVNLLGRFNAGIDATMDGAFELADQQYRNASKIIAGVFSIALAIVAGWLVDGGHQGQLFSYPDIGEAILAGLIAVPLAPVAKDLTSSLQAAVTAMKAIKS